MDVRLDGNATDVSERQYLKACSPMDVTPDGSEIETSEAHS